MVISQYFNIFILFSFFGWIFECTYCTIKGKHWENRGFLYGPVCPIYGFCVVLALVIFGSLLDGTFSFETGYDAPAWLVFLICAGGSAVVEFVTSWVLEKCFHAIWWDYSNVPFNLQGRICLPASCGFGLAGIVIVKLVFPLIETYSMGTHPLLQEALSLLLSMILGMDLALTVASLTKILERMEAFQDDFDERMEDRVKTLQQGPAAVGSAAKSAAADATETAAIAAMLAADALKEKADAAREKSEGKPGVLDLGKLPPEPKKKRKEMAEEEREERIRKLTEGFSGMDRYHIRSIRAFRPSGKKDGDASEKMRKLFEEIQKKTGTPQERQKKKK